MNSLPDGLIDALGRVVAEARQEFRKDVERMAAESRLVVAELRADILEFKTELKSAADRELARIPEALANVKDGAPGKDGMDGAPGRDGVDGKDGANGVDGAPGVNGVDGKDGLNGNNGTDGIAGKDGTDGSPGRDGVNGIDGAPGQAGKDADPEVVAALVAETVAKAVSALPVAKDGAPGKDGADGMPGRDGRDGLAGHQGEKGIDGTNGKDGTNGIDGMGFDDLGVDYDGERTFTLTFTKGERVEKFPITLPVPIYRGIYKPGAQYARGDMVTFGGSTHVAENDTTARPESGKDWKLCVKRGRDGQDGILKEPPKPKIVKV